MTAYKNYIQHFPIRCMDVLETFEWDASEIDREVTLSLAIATPCLIVPYERLNSEDHPSKDRERFVEAKKTWDVELRKKCGKSCLWRNSFEDTWRFKQLDEVSGDPDSWKLNNETEPITAKKTKLVLSILRNALAHGNIWTTGDPIETLVFVSRVCYRKPQGPFNTLQCSPQLLVQFIKNWVGFLKDLEIPAEPSVETKFFRD